MKKIGYYGEEANYFIVGIHKNKDQFIVEAQQLEDGKIESSNVHKGYLYGEIGNEASYFSKIEKPENIKKYGKESECFYVEEDDIEEAE